MAENADIGRAIAAFVREEFGTPVAALRDLIDTFAVDTARAGLDDYADDVQRMLTSCDRLSALISNLLSSGSDASEVVDTSRLRHDLRTPVSSIIGYAELIAEIARENDHTMLFPSLADILEASGRLLKDLDRLVHVSDAIGDADASADPRRPLPDVFRMAADAVERLIQHPAPAATRVTGRVLVVDDNAAMRELVARRLTREGHTVEVCAGGHAGLRMAASRPFDLMLLDLMMPGMTGFEVLGRLRADAATRDLPVIVISALDEIDAAVRCIAAGADDYLAKPLNETLLRARISSSLERKFLRDRERETADRLRIEQARTDRLLRNVLPASVVDRLAKGETLIADHFDDASVLFCDIVGFTALTNAVSASETLELLNAVFSSFDELAEQYGLEKIKTVGDAYMVVGGISRPVEDHVARMVRMARMMPGAASTASRRLRLSVRIGIAAGPVVAGIIGSQKFFYDVWGSTVNIASRLEASAQPGQIHVSESVVAAAGESFQFDSRGHIELKGFGEVQTYRLSY